ncbi:glycerophosphodiester phosphodiesterase [Aeromicrobium wangtongii]|uniref:Glycerophosphodiester phosphodiesterase n=1 Tax=Aeromicrobium wangtongii TaxID=2969247 RepID=A0ABY5MDZ8_9ACTN|nr:glycerophosphodiester phosphodiesterase [Aeromicrobium wangtongii]MCD9199702.1 glycerophosphodiester phosphodiesterase [Aeromicrobium wangtongii]UUP14051.1 glycerophosphodiester phosphodiesterase [Aeromicrobium wangtongii]
MVLISAHRGGAADDHSSQNTLAAFEQAIAMGCDYVEFDVRLTADGVPVVFHDDELSDGTARSIAGHRHDQLTETALVTLDEVLTLIRGRIKAHVDLKVRHRALDLVQHVVATLGADDVIITTAEDSTVRRIVAWSRENAPGLLVGLSSSPRSWDGRPWRRRLVRLEAAFPRTRIRLSHANLVVSHKALARWSLRSYARRRGLPLLVWTVDRPAELDRWMNDASVWMVTTNYPERALAAVR